MEIDFSDLYFNNDQLKRLVSSAEVILKHLYKLVSAENKVFIDQWFCYKKEYDHTCKNDSQFDVNENIPETSTLARIDEVSENGKASSVSSISSSDISEDSEENENYLNVETEKVENNSETHEFPPVTDVQTSQMDSDLLEYMNEFKLLTDSFVSDWFKTLSFSTAEVKQYMNWLENAEYKRIWTDIYNNIRKNSQLYDDEQLFQTGNFAETGFIPIETSQIQSKPVNDIVNQNKSNSVCQKCKDTYRKESIDNQINDLQKIRNNLLSTRENLNAKFKKDELKSSVEFRHFLKVEVAFEIIDISIEMKNQINLGHDIQQLYTLNDEVDSIIATCLRTLSVNEIRHLLMTYLTNVIDMRKFGSEYDKQILNLDSEISNQKFLIWRLYMMISENKRSYESRCLTLHKEFEQKLQLIGKFTTDESNDESVTGLQGRKLLSIFEKHDIRETSHSDSKDPKEGQVVSLIPNIPERSLKTLQNTSGTSGTKVTRNKKKLIIQTQKH